MNNSDIIGLIGLLFAVIAIIISIYQFTKYRTSSPTEMEIKVVNELIDKIIEINYSITYFTYIEKLKIRKAFTISGNNVSLAEKIETKIEKNAIKYSLIASEDFVVNNYFEKFSNNRYLSEGLRKNLKKFKFKFENKSTTESELIESNYNFALLDQNNPVEIIISIGTVPYRRFSIRKGNYKYITYKEKRMTAEDLKNIIDEIDKELKNWLNDIGKKHMYEKKKDSLVPNKKLNEVLNKLRREIDKNLSVDVFSATNDSQLAKELAKLKKNKVS
jgi:hypothetical protein